MGITDMKDNIFLLNLVAAKSGGW